MIDRKNDYGSVSEVWAPEGYGFIQTRAGERVYFDRGRVHPDHFHRLFVGTEVEFRRELGDRGWVARDVVVVRQNTRLLPLN